MLIRNKITGETREVPDEQAGRLGIAGQTQTAPQDNGNNDIQQVLLMKALEDPKHASWYSSISNMLPKETATEKKTRVDLEKSIKGGFTKIDEINSIFDEFKGQKISGFEQGLKAKYGGGFPREGGIGKLIAPSEGTNRLQAAISDYNTRLFDIAGKAFTGPEKDLLAGLVLNIGDDQARMRDKMVQASKMIALKASDSGVSLPKQVVSQAINPTTKSNDNIDTSSDTPVDKREFWQRVFNTGKESLNVPIPDLPYGAVGMTGASFGKTPVAGGVIAGAGKYLDNLKEKGIPLTRDAASSYGGANPFKGANAEVIKATLAGTGLNAIMHPLKTLGTIRSDLLNRAVRGGASLPDQTIVPQAGKNFFENLARPEQVKTGKNLQKIDLKKFGNTDKFSAQGLLDEISSRGKGAFSQGQELRSTSSAAYNASIRDALRKQLSNISPTAGKITGAMGKIYNTKSATGNIIKRLLPYLVIGKVLKGN